MGCSEALTGGVDGTCAAVHAGSACGAATCTGSTRTDARTCSATGICSPGVVTMCLDHFGCADGGTSCGASCGVTGNPPNGTSVGCASGAFCDTVPATPACTVTLKATSAACVNDFECASGTCAAGNCS